jgi:MOSC domain-containing protein
MVLGSLASFENMGGLALYGVTFLMLLISLAIVLSKPRSLPTYRIKSIRIHPIKSCRGIEVDRAYLEGSGLRLDRRWMFVNGQGKFQTIREQSRMTLIKTAILHEDGEEMLQVTVQDTDIKFTIPTFPSDEWLEQNTTKENVRIWRTETDANVYSESLTAPISEFLGQPVRLVVKGTDHRRILTGNAAPEHLGREEHMAFPDLGAMLVTNSGSLDEFNERLIAKGEQAIPMERFRPNVVVEPDVNTPWLEDQWKTLRFGGSHRNDNSEDDKQSPLIVDVTSRCARCQVPNVDSNTGIKHAKEPWSTLMSYRRVDEGMKYKPCFGMLCVPRDAGNIWVGMEVFVTQTTKMHKLLQK